MSYKQYMMLNLYTKCLNKAKKNEKQNWYVPLIEEVILIICKGSSDLNKYDIQWAKEFLEGKYD